MTRDEIDDLKFYAGFSAAFCLLTVVIVALGTAIAYPLASAGCHARWQGSGHATDYGFFSRCRVQLEDGAWVPESRLINMRSTH